MVVAASRTAYELYLFGDGEVLLDIPRHLAMISRIQHCDPQCRQLAATASLPHILTAELRGEPVVL
ncbi:MAG: hypothetical protein ABSH50_20120 [Bryobacteraceae bacterium]